MNEEKNAEYFLKQTDKFLVLYGCIPSSTFMISAIGYMKRLENELVVLRNEQK